MLPLRVQGPALRATAFVCLTAKETYLERNKNKEIKTKTKQAQILCETLATGQSQIDLWTLLMPLCGRSPSSRATKAQKKWLFQGRSPGLHRLSPPGSHMQPLGAQLSADKGQGEAHLRPGDLEVRGSAGVNQMYTAIIPKPLPFPAPLYPPGPNFESSVS